MGVVVTSGREGEGKGRTKNGGWGEKSKARTRVVYQPARWGGLRVGKVDDRERKEILENINGGGRGESKKGDGRQFWFMTRWFLNHGKKGKETVPRKFYTE